MDVSHSHSMRQPREPGAKAEGVERAGGLALGREPCAKTYHQTPIIT